METDQRRVAIDRKVSLGNFISPVLTVAALGIPALIWGGRIDSRVEHLAGDLTRNMSAMRAEMAGIQTASNTMSSTMVGMNISINEGLKQGMAELGRRVVNLEARVDKQADEITRLQIELATIKKSSGR